MVRGRLATFEELAAVRGLLINSHNFLTLL